MDQEFQKRIKLTCICGATFEIADNQGIPWARIAEDVALWRADHLGCPELFKSAIKPAIVCVPPGTAAPGTLIETTT